MSAVAGVARRLCGQEDHGRGWDHGPVRCVGLVLHPRRNADEAIAKIVGWAANRGTAVLGLAAEMERLADDVLPVSYQELRDRPDLLVSLGGDGTMLRAMRMADGARAPVLGVNLGKLGFLAEVDVPDLPYALSAIDEHRFTVEPRLAVDATVRDQRLSAFNDVAVVRVPGQGTARVRLLVQDQPFVSYAADAVVVATTTGSTAYSFSAGGPIVSPSVEALLVTPAAPHSAYNRGLVLSVDDGLTLELLPTSGPLAVEIDGQVACYVTPGDAIHLRARPAAAQVIRLGLTTFYQRAQRKLRLTDSAELDPTHVPLTTISPAT
jgi:NAD+ kinase